MIHVVCKPDKNIALAEKNSFGFQDRLYDNGIE
jgi:hypothetical protein